MNFGKDRRRKHSVCEANSPNFMVESEEFQHRTSRRRSFQGKQNSRERDFFAPDDIEEWVLPEYRSLFHHLFLKEDEDMVENQPGSSSGIGSRDNSSPITSSNIASLQARRRKVSPSGSTASSTATEDEGPLCNLVKSLPSWLKKVFNISENEQQQNAEEIDRHAWLDEIPIEICDKLRHIHIYV